MKICRQCNRNLPIEDFYIHARMADGRLNKCKTCVKTRVAVHREANLDRIQAYDRSRADAPHRVAKRQEIATHLPTQVKRIYQKKYRHKYPTKARARSVFARARRKGLVIKPADCQQCGTVKRLHAHHDDYSKPLEVRWLCASCHGAHHKTENERRRQERIAA